jgi:hypothetical protein
MIPRMTKNSSLLAALLFLVCLEGQAKEVPKIPAGAPGEVLFDSAATQSRIAGDRPIAAAALENTRLKTNAGSSFGFAAKSPEARFFLVGAYYSEALALVRGGKTADAERRLEAIERLAVDLGAPSGLYSFITRAHSHVSRNDLPREALLEYLSLLQPLFSDFARSQSSDKLALFNTGAWVTDMGLAAAAGDVTQLRQSVEMKRVVVEMKRMDAPKGVQEALGEIAAISEQKEIGERDAKKVLTLVQKIQSLLG